MNKLVKEKDENNKREGTNEVRRSKKGATSTKNQESFGRNHQKEARQGKKT